MESQQERDRISALRRYHSGEELSLIASSLGYSRRWIYKWVARFEESDPAGEWYKDRPSHPHHNPRCVGSAVEEVVKQVRLRLEEQGLFSGAQAIEWELEDQGLEPRPSLRTINRILNRRGLIHRRRGRYQPHGKVYPNLTAHYVNEVHQTDYVGPCYLSSQVRFYSLHSVDLATGRCAINPVLSKVAQNTIQALWSSWCRLGIPQHQQVDNELVFSGSHRHPRGMGPLIRLCLLHNVQPWFIPMAEPWRNGVVEKFNDHYRDRFLNRVVLSGEADLRRESLLFEQRHNSRYRYSKLNGQTPQAVLEQSRRKVRFPALSPVPRVPLPKPKSGRYHLIRFIRSNRILDVFGERFTLPPETVYEYVVATVDVKKQTLQAQIGSTLVEEYPYRMR